ncbi:hypothetical protein OF83DRAFT_1071827 [Amylostereum chailletii]|nr:hypothetical protein OF83DRAFT_1071827 [Amylostereum chailletii]
MPPSPTLALLPLPSPDFSDGESDVAEASRTSDESKLVSVLHTREEGIIQYERRLGDSELSYYLPGRAIGVNDMYLHLGLRAPERLMHKERVCAVWSIMRMRHPLLASQVVMRGYEDVRFVYSPPLSPEDALSEADRHLEFKYASKDDLIDSYLNGPRTLSSERLSWLIISRTPTTIESLPSPPLTPTDIEAPDQEAIPTERSHNYEFFICAAHTIGDGMALHAFANDFFGILGSPKSQVELQQLVVDEWTKRLGRPASAEMLPSSVEDSLPPAKGAFHRVVGRADFQIAQSKQIGGHSFPRHSDPVRHTVVPTVSFDEHVTKAMLKKCKSEGVSIAAALFAICNIAWGKMTPREKTKLPMMMYAAMNIRPCLVPRPLNDSYWFLAVGYFNVVLPSFIPSTCDVSKTLWLRARSSKEQILRAAKTPLISSRNREMSLKRGQQARTWAREDDAKEAGTWLPPPQPTKTDSSPVSSPPPPSAALLGLSMLGNLDAVYKHASFPGIKLHTLTTGSRQRHGGMLLFGYTFAGKLWVSLGYDENGFERKPLDIFWDNMLQAMTDLLV